MLISAVAAHAQFDNLTVKLNKPDAKGVATFDIVDKASGTVLTQNFRIDGGTFDIFMGAENTGYLDISPNTNKITVSELVEGERLVLASIKLTALESMAVGYIAKVDLVIPQ